MHSIVQLHSQHSKEAMMYIVHSSHYIERFEIAAIDSYLAHKLGYIGTAKLVPCTIELFAGFVG